MIAAAEMDETGKSAWCRERGVYPAELDQWRASRDLTGNPPMNYVGVGEVPYNARATRAYWYLNSHKVVPGG